MEPLELAVMLGLGAEGFEQVKAIELEADGVEQVLVFAAI